MSETINVEARVDELSKPENKSELNKVLNEGFGAGTQTAEAKPAEAAPAEEAKPAENKDGDENKGGTADDLSKQNAGEAEIRKNKVAELLADKNAAQTGAAEAQTEVQILTKRVEDLTKLLEKTAGKAGEVADENVGADDTDKGKTTEQIVKETLEKIEAAKNATLDAEKSQTEQIQALDTNPKTPNAKDYVDELKAIMAKHTSLSAYAAYRMLQGEGVIPMEGVNSSNANRTGTGNRPKTTLLNNRKPEDMSQAESLAYLKEAEKAGDLVGRI